MIEVSIHADVRDYTEKPILNLTARKLACIGVAAGVALSLGAILVNVWDVPMDIAAWPLIAVCVPVWLAGFWSPMGMAAEEYLALYLDHRYGPNHLPYETRPCEQPPAGKPRSRASAKKRRNSREWTEGPNSRRELARFRRACKSDGTAPSATARPRGGRKQ